MHDPAAALARGWSVTRTADGALVRSVADVAPGDPLVTTVADGCIDSHGGGSPPRRRTDPGTRPTQEDP